MSFSVGAITGIIGLDEKPALRSMKDTVRASEDFKKAVEKNFDQAAKSGSSSFKSALAGIKGEFGKSSAFGQALKLAAGGGAIAALGLAASKFKEISTSIADMATQAQLGKQSYSDMALKIGLSLPVIGDVAQGFLSLGKAALGFDAITQAADATIKKIEEWRGQMVSLKTLSKDFADSAARQKLGFAVDSATGFQKALGSGFGPVEDANKSREQSFLDQANKAGGYSFKTPDDFLAEKQRVDYALPLVRARVESERAANDALNAARARHQDRVDTNNTGPEYLPWTAAHADKIAIQTGDESMQKAVDAADDLAGQKAKLDELTKSYNSMREAVFGVGVQQAKLTGGGFLEALLGGANVVKEAADKGKDALKEHSDQVLAFRKSVDPTVAFKETIDYATKALASGEISPQEARLASKQALEQLRSSTDSTFYATKVQAEDVFGKRTVTGADQSQVFDSIDKHCEEMAVNLKKLADDQDATPAVKVTVVNWP